MAYLHIDNLYKDQRVLLFKKLWATEKIHGTSAWITYKDRILSYHSGGGSYDLFITLFDHELLLQKLQDRFGEKEVKLHGEFYGGKLQKMSHVYGKESNFIMFDVKVGEVFLSHDKVLKLCDQLDLPVVESEIIDATIEEIERITKKPSAIGIQKGLGEHIREGIVLKPLNEFIDNNGKRVIAKHKNEQYAETSTPRKVQDPERLKRLDNAKEIAFEWVTANRLEHVLDHLGKEKFDKRDTKNVIDQMIEDVKREAEGEIEWNREIERSIGEKGRELFFNYLKEVLRNV